MYTQSFVEGAKGLQGRGCTDITPAKGTCFWCSNAFSRQFSDGYSDNVRMHERIGTAPFVVDINWCSGFIAAIFNLLGMSLYDLHFRTMGSSFLVDGNLQHGQQGD